MTITVTLLAPQTGISYQCRSGTSYTPDANGFIRGVVAGAGQDVFDLLNDGCIVVGTSVNVGTAATGVVATEYGDAYRHVTLLAISTTLPAIVGGASLGVGKKLYTLPAGAQIIKEARFSVAITQTEAHINADTPVVGLGTSIASGAVSVLSGTAAFQNIGAGKAAANCTGTPTAQTAKATGSPFELVTEPGGAKDIYLNAAAAWSASGDAAALLTGSAAIVWDMLPS